MDSSQPAGATAVGGSRLLLEGILGGVISVVIVAVPPHFPWIFGGSGIAGFVVGARTKAGVQQSLRLGLFIAGFLAVFSLIAVAIAGFEAALIPRSSLVGTPFADFDVGFALLLALGVSVYGLVLGTIGSIFGGMFARRKVA